MGHFKMTHISLINLKRETVLILASAVNVGHYLFLYGPPQEIKESLGLFLSDQNSYALILLSGL